MPELNHKETLDNLRRHLNNHTWVGIDHGGVFEGMHEDSWTSNEVDLLAEVLASAPQEVRAGLAAMLAAPNLVYPDLLVEEAT